MAQSNLLVDDRDQEFVLNEMLGVETLCAHDTYAEHSGETFGLALSAARKFAMAELHPVAKEAEEVGCVYDPNTQAVTAPACFHAPYKLLTEAGWLAMCDEEDVGGQGFPFVIGAAVSEIFYAGCFALYGGAMLNHAAGKSIELYGTGEQKKLYLDNLYGGAWGGTMVLTESDAGSDLRRIRTSATPQPDGTYKISGRKIFISQGEHDLTPNIIHIVLARAEGDPEGTKGLSAFIVPKILEDGTRNDVYCTSIEHKMGQHSIVTASLSFGENDGCVGYLLGPRMAGIKVFFHMMNEQRLLVGLQGLSMASKAYLYALDYTKERVQGSAPGEPQGFVPIIEHPDVKRMLMEMKTQVEGCRAMSYYAYYCMDQARISQGDEKAKWDGLVGLLTPVVKAYNAEKVWRTAASAIQCAGGYGYCSEYPFEQIARDCKMTSIYEGANGIQANDLVFRKLLRNGLKDFANLMALMDQTIGQANQVDSLKAYAAILDEARAGLGDVLQSLLSSGSREAAKAAFPKAAHILEAFGDVVLGWFHLWSLTIAQTKLDALQPSGLTEQLREIATQDGEVAFYWGKSLGAKYYLGSILQRTFGKIRQLQAEDESVNAISPEAFA
ncbi:MAG: acyl-CoA dehydrogenase [Deltaproteobacteria bacterium]|nr:acyl-CoA dehydrogenase [Deltaproteobacteria bacterium]